MSGATEITHEVLPTVPLPHLRLHREHVAASNIPVPLSRAAVRACLNRASGDPAAAVGASSFVAQKSGAHLLIRDEGGTTLFDHLALTLGFAFLRKEASTGRLCIVLALPKDAPQEERGCWILLADGDEAAVRRALWALGSGGTIVSDPAAICEVASEPLGRGSTAVVHQACLAWRSEAGSPTDVVVKIPQHRSGNELEHLRKEVSALAAVQGHPNVVRLYGFVHVDATFCDTVPSQPSHSIGVMMEYCSAGDVFDGILHGPMEENRVRDVTEGVLRALEHVHRCGIVHRDVKADNVLLRFPNTPVLADFGIAAHHLDQTEMSRKCGSPGYAAPEMFGTSGYDFKVDSFGLGIVAFFSLCGRPPFWGSTVQSTLRRTVKCRVEFTHPLFDFVSEGCKGFIVSMLEKDPRRRLSARDALRHRWIVADAALEKQRLTISSESTACTLDSSAAPSESCQDSGMASLASLALTDDGSLSKAPTLPFVGSIPSNSRSPTYDDAERFRSSGR